jgi:5'-nucleotidase
MRRFAIAAALLAVAACQDDPASNPVTPVDPAAQEFRGVDFFQLTLLHNNDGESDLLPDGDIGGIGRFVSLVEQLRTEGDDCSRTPFDCGTLLVSSGDNFLAGPNLNASLELPDGTPFYDAVALDRLDYDAIAIGNHEFDFGPDVLADFIAGFSTSMPPFLSANLDVSGEPELAALESAGRIAKSTVVEVNGARFGIIGATTERLATISSPRGVAVLQDVAGAVNAEVAALEGAGIDRIILISHLQSLEEDRALVGMLSGVDIVVSGGGDELLQGYVRNSSPLLPGDERAGGYPAWARDADRRGVPIVTTAGGYTYVGRLSVRFLQGRVSSVDYRNSGPVRVFGPDGIVADGDIVANVETPVAAAVDALATNIIANTQVTLDGTRSLVRTRETNYGNLIADAQLEVARSRAANFGLSGVDVGLQNGGGIRNSVILDAGSDISELDTFTTLPFTNFLSVVEGVTRQRFKEVMENAVSRVEFTDGRFAQIAGFTMEYDPTGQPQIIDVESGLITQRGERVLNVTLDDGTPIVVEGVVQSGPALNVVVNSFAAGGGDQYPLADLPSTTVGTTYQQALRIFLEDAEFLGGSVSAADYPVGGEGRITTR